MQRKIVPIPGPAATPISFENRAPNLSTKQLQRDDHQRVNRQLVEPLRCPKDRIPQLVTIQHRIAVADLHDAHPVRTGRYHDLQQLLLVTEIYEIKGRDFMPLVAIGVERNWINGPEQVVPMGDDHFGHVIVR